MKSGRSDPAPTIKSVNHATGAFKKLRTRRPEKEMLRRKFVKLLRQSCDKTDRKTQKRESLRELCN